MDERGLYGVGSFIFVVILLFHEPENKLYLWVTWLVGQFTRLFQLLRNPELVQIAFTFYRHIACSPKVELYFGNNNSLSFGRRSEEWILDWRKEFKLTISSSLSFFHGPSTQFLWQKRWQRRHESFTTNRIDFEPAKDTAGIPKLSSRPVYSMNGDLAETNF